MALIVGPGEDDEHERLVIQTRVIRGSIMEAATGEAEAVYFLEIESRSLGSYEDRQVHRFGMTPAQATHAALDLAVELRGEQQ